MSGPAARQNNPAQEPATAELPRALEQCLLAAATELGGELDTRRLAQRLADVLTCLPGLVVCGLSVYDAERERFTTYTVSGAGSPTVRGVDVAEHSAADAGLLPTARPRDYYVSPDLAQTRPLPIQQRLYDLGVRHYAVAPLLLNERLLGGLLAGFARLEAAGATTQHFLLRLARVIAPILWNCHTHARFQHGDRRRDALVELSDAINMSLKLQTVLDSARQAIRRLDGHIFSAVKLINEDGNSYRSYRNFSDQQQAGAGDRPDPLIQPLEGTAMAHIIQTGRTYQSEDLRRDLRFVHDAEMRSFGVRRYVATPMFVRGRIIGGFLMGSDDPRPALGVDVWLYENIALQLALAIDNAEQLERVERLSERLAQQNVYLREEIQQEHDFSEMVGRSLGMRRVQEAIARVAATNSTVLILGETGVGKELVARAIHAASTRAEHPMVKVNCAAIPETMVESELFGHERGAFTSAVERRIGRFELAREGTLFLDEIGELPNSVQAKLLRVLQDGEFERVGGTKTLTSDARIIAATNRDLLRSVEDGTFRSDLYYRLNVFPIEIPSLRERREDIPLLVDFFLNQFSRRMGKRVRRADPAALGELQQRDWPGNIRELRHVIERAMILCDRDQLTIDDVGASDRPAAATPSPAAAEAGVRGGNALPTLEEMEAEHIRRALSETGGVIEGPRGAAALLDLKPSTLRFRMKRLGIQRKN